MSTTSFKIGNVDLSNYVAALKVDKNYLTSDYSGRNAAGTMRIDLIATKYKVNVTFKPMTTTEASTILGYISGYADISISFLNPNTNTLTNATCYIGTPSVEYYRLSNNMEMVKSFSISFIEQ